MATASFFSKSALSAAQILSGVSQADFTGRVESARINVVFGAGAISSEGRIALEMLVNLLARLFPSFAITPLGEEAAPLSEELRTLALSINPVLEIRNAQADDLTVAVGRVPAPSPGKAIYIGSDGWIARLSRSTPQSCGGTGLPFGAAAAACLACANLFRSIFKDALTGGEPDGELHLSLWNYDNAGADAPSIPSTIGDFDLAGAGAVGNGFLWTLARLPGLRGTINVVDPEPIEIGNLQRYVLTDANSVGRPKTTLAAEKLAGTNLTVVPHPLTWGSYLASRQDRLIETVVVALDSAKDRIEVQGTLPYRIVNAWTQKDNLGVSRHLDFLQAPCLACLYIPDGAVPNEDEEVARSLKLAGPQHLMEVRILLHSGAPLSEEFVARVATLAGKEPAALSQFVGRSLRELYSGAVCGGMLLALGGDHLPSADVPMPFQSALAGVMLAAELIAIETGVNRVTTTSINLLRPLAPYLSFPAEKRPNCICGDPIFRRVYEQKWTRRINFSKHSAASEAPPK